MESVFFLSCWTVDLYPDDKILFQFAKSISLKIFCFSKQIIFFKNITVPYLKNAVFSEHLISDS
jgi:hypothetical protein